MRPPHTAMWLQRWASLLPRPLSDRLRRMPRRYCAMAIPSSSALHCLDGRCEHLQSKNDLGFHSEVCPTGIAQLIAAGNINGSRKTLNPHKAVCTALWGDAFTLDFAHLNPAIELRRMRYQ